MSASTATREVNSQRHTWPDFGTTALSVGSCVFVTHIFPLREILLKMVDFKKCCLRDQQVLAGPSPPSPPSSFLSASTAAPSLQAFVTERRACRSPSAHSASRPALVAGHQMTSPPSLRRSQVSSFQQPPVPLPWSAAGHAGRGDICLSEDKGIGCLTFRLSGPPAPHTPQTTAASSSFSSVILRAAI